MLSPVTFKQSLFHLQPVGFEETALRLFRYQAAHNAIYKKYLELLGRNPDAIQSLTDIPFLPISFFKTHRILTGSPTVEQVFESSGTTGQVRSQHHVADLAFYKGMSRKIFEDFYGSLTNYHILALLPSYLERETSSLVVMADYFIQESRSEHSGFYLNNTNALLEKIQFLKSGSRKILLLGVTFALLDLAERNEAPDLSGVIVMETGGMKGRRREMIREEVHAILCNRLNISEVHSEYGMTELLSQGYSKGNGIFQAASTMKILLRDLNDPFAPSPDTRYGGINIIDLANVDSCAFIETQDLGQLTENGGFSVMGRFDNSEVRGCSLMVI